MAGISDARKPSLIHPQSSIATHKGDIWMETPENQESGAAVIEPQTRNSSQIALASDNQESTPSVAPSGGSCGCDCGTKSNEPSGFAYVYALGRVEPRLPTLGIEKEFAQATGRGGAAGLSDRQALHEILTKPENRYLVRQLCWVLSIEGVETYILQPRDAADFGLLVEAVRPSPRSTDVDVVIGVRGPIAPPEMCNGLLVPIVVFDQLYSFDVDSLIGSIPRPENIPTERFTPAAEELFNRIMQIADNAGATDEHRALNYLVLRYRAVYATVAEAFGNNSSLSSIDVRPSRLSNTRKVVDVVFSFRHRESDVVDKHFVRVDVTEEFPFLLTKMAPYFDR
jgi:hypothetical protein